MRQHVGAASVELGTDADEEIDAGVASEALAETTVLPVMRRTTSPIRNPCVFT